MTKFDLEVGMVVVLRNGDVRMVLNTSNMGVVLTNGAKACELAKYNTNMENEGRLGSYFDIMEVYGHPACGGQGGLLQFGINTLGREKLYSRAVREVTMEELHDLLGYKVKIIE